MKNLHQISTIQVDVLKEIANIGAAHSATAFSKMVNKRVNINIPNVKLSSFNELLNTVGADKVVASISVRMKGEVNGSVFLILPLMQAESFASVLTGVHCLNLLEENKELVNSALLEMGNILLGSYVSSLADFVHLNVYPSVPELVVDMFGAIISEGLLETSRLGDQVIAIESAIFEEEDPLETIINGQFFLFIDPDSFSSFFQRLGV
ncbi:chemotaxis protein CheC [Bacillus carboniphilus]|uniref:Chemotaxis protein CheC n=1 Tax=Bacillus carboniphilus TaxID=86663 RepID=A0ABY9K103_9BACI|nr:chemotaxis protein CheC [Bacillus carboniphilus]WLR43520.1 chemotaxis protein CheC [Bacillus carboniphilus]